LEEAEVVHLAGLLLYLVVVVEEARLMILPSDAQEAAAHLVKVLGEERERVIFRALWTIEAVLVVEELVKQEAMVLVLLEATEEKELFLKLRVVLFIMAAAVAAAVLLLRVLVVLVAAGLLCLIQTAKTV